VSVSAGMAACDTQAHPSRCRRERPDGLPEGRWAPCPMTERQCSGDRHGPGCVHESGTHRRPVTHVGHPRRRPDDPASVWRLSLEEASDRAGRRSVVTIQLKGQPRPDGTDGGLGASVRTLPSQWTVESHVDFAGKPRCTLRVHLRFPALSSATTQSALARSESSSTSPGSLSPV
jgi:hypothetical protein